MKKFEINYKSKASINAYVLFNNFSFCFMFSILLFAISSLVSVLFDYYEFLIPAIVSIVFFAVSFVLLFVIYIKSSHTIIVEDDKLVIHFGYKEVGKAGYADIKTKINAYEIENCMLEMQYERLESTKLFLLMYDNKTYNETRIEIVNGNYDEPFVKIVLKGDRVLYLPAKNAAELCKSINMICEHQI